MSESQSEFVAISVKPQTRQRLRILKAEEEYKNYDSIIQTLLKNTDN